MQPVTAYVQARACDDFGEGPSYASLVVDDSFAARLRTLRTLAKDNQLSEVRMLSTPAWDNEDALRLRNVELVVCYDTFWFTADPEHANYHVETDAQGIEEFLAAVVQGQTRFGDYSEDEWDELLEDASA